MGSRRMLTTILSAGLALTLLAVLTPTSTFAQGQATNSASIGLTSGPLSVNPGGSNVSFPGVVLDGHQHQITADVGSPVVVEDATGWGNGWTLSVSSQSFKEQTPSSGSFASGTSARTMPAGSLTLATDSSVSPVGTTSPLPTNMMQGSASVIDGGSGVNVVGAAPNAGMGIFNVNFPSQALTLTLNPSTTYVDTVNYPNGPTPYSSVITWTLSTGPASVSPTTTWSGNLSKTLMANGNWSIGSGGGMVAGNGTAVAVAQVSNLSPLASGSTVNLNWASQTHSSVMVAASIDGSNYTTLGTAPNTGGSLNGVAQTFALPSSFAGATTLYLKYTEVWDNTVMQYSYSAVNSTKVNSGNYSYTITPQW